MTMSDKYKLNFIFFGKQPGVHGYFRCALKAILLVAGLALSLPLLAPGQARAADFLVNTTTAGNQQQPKVAALPNGDFLVIWRNSDDLSLRAQRFGGTGTAEGAEFVISSAVNQDPAIAVLPDGGFVVAWVGSDGDGLGIHMLRFDTSGLAIGSAVTVNTTTANHQLRAGIAAFSDGGFVIVWEDDGPDNLAPDAGEIRAQRFDAAGAPLGGEFHVNTTTTTPQSLPRVASDSTDTFLVVWHDSSATGGDTDSGAIRAQRYDKLGNPQGGEFLVNTTTSGSQTQPDVAGLPGGGFIIAWKDNSQSGGDTDSGAIRAQRLDSAGNPQGSEFLVNTTTAGSQAFPAIAGLYGGGFVIFWADFSQSGGDTDSAAIRAQRYDGSGNPAGAEFLANTITAGSQNVPDVAALPGGDYVATWRDGSNSAGDMASTDIRASLFSVPSSATTLFSSVLPAARSGFVGGSDITVFASVVNAGSNPARNCIIILGPNPQASMKFQKTNAANVPTGVAGAPFALAPGQSASFVLSFTPLATGAINAFPHFTCPGATNDAIPGVNVVLITIDASAGPDVLSIGATPDGNGIITVPAEGASFMTVSATNIGAGDTGGSADAAMEVLLIARNTSTGAALPLSVQICETDALSVCTSALGTFVNSVIGSGPSFFAVFVSDNASGGLPLDAANVRIVVRFKDSSGTIRSETSAAVTVP